MDLLELGCGATRTVCVNRKGIPQQLKDKKVNKGEMFSMTNKELMLLKFHDRNVVYVMSTIEEVAKFPTGRLVPRTGTPIELPSVVCSYNQYMEGVDCSDQMISSPH